MDAEGLKALFEPVGPVAVKRMFGGHGVYADGLCFAIQWQGEVYLKTDAESEKVHADAGSAPFVYVARGKPMATSYWRLVPSAYDDPDELKRWTALAIEAARRVAAAKTHTKKVGTTRAPPARVAAARPSLRAKRSNPD